MKSKSILIRMEVMYFNYNAHKVGHISVQFHLQLIPFIKFHFIELNLVLSYFDYFVQKIV